MTDQLREWQGEFGEAYTDRNNVDWHERVPALADILAGLDVYTVVEVGCNRGHNLLALQDLDKFVTGIEPQRHARELAHADGLNVLPGDIYDTKWFTGISDLVLCCGVLIHVPPDRIAKAMSELVRISGRYILSIEYAATTEREVEYQGMSNMLWKRPYGDLWENLSIYYEGNRTGVTMLRTGELGPVWDNATYWLMEIT